MSRRRRLAIALGLFGLMLAIGLLQPTGLFAPADRLAMTIVERLRQLPGASLVTMAAGLLDRIGQGGGRLFIAMVIGLFLARAGRPRSMIWLMITVAAMIVINPLVKLVFAAPRPDAIEQLILVTSHSFPSGHAAGAMTLYGAIALLWRNPAVGLFCTAMILATGLSRVWLGVHWPSDVMGGWIEGAAWLVVMTLFLPGNERPVTPVRIAADRHDSSTP